MRSITSRLVGVAAAVTTLAAGGAAAAVALAAEQAQAAQSSQQVSAAAKPLPTRLSYTWRGYRTYDQLHDYTTLLQAPTGWQLRNLGHGQAHFTGGGGLWQLRSKVLTGAANPQSYDLRTRIAGLRTIKGVRIIGSSTGSVRTSYGVREYTTLAYSYPSSAGTRYVLTRWVETANYAGPRVSHVELNTVGRPADAAGMQYVLAQATKSVHLTRVNR